MSTQGKRGKLEYLESSNLFIVPLDDERRWYRYHHLCADLLHSQLNKSQPNLVPTLHHRASEWYEQEGLTNEDWHHAFVAEDSEQAAILLEESGQSFTFRGELTTLLNQPHL